MEFPLCRAGSISDLPFLFFGGVAWVFMVQIGVSPIEPGYGFVLLEITIKKIFAILRFFYVLLLTF